MCLDAALTGSSATRHLDKTTCTSSYNISEKFHVPVFFRTMNSPFERSQ